MWLDSSLESGPYANWSFIMNEPSFLIKGGGGSFVFTGADGKKTAIDGNPLGFIEKILARYKTEKSPSVKYPPFTGGMAGFFGYGLTRYTEPSARINWDRDFAPEGDLWLGCYLRLIAFDHARKKTFLVVNHAHDESPEPALEELERLMGPSQAYGAGAPVSVENPLDIAPVKEFTREEYIESVEKIREYIADGDCYQVNLSQAFESAMGADAKTIYEKLRVLSPAPFASYLDCGRFQILSSSPERFVSVRDGSAQTRPIKGTRPRGATEEEDQRMRGNLSASQKDRAENVMIVDLMRNDLSKVCEPFSVTVPEICAVEEYATVYHLTSTVEGRIKEGVGPIGVLNAVFPPGSVTGAPKTRALEIIDELEPTPRGAYCGAIGYVGFDGDMDLSVAIRIMVCSGRQARFHAGGGVTYSSSAVKEYEETLHKAKAIMEALNR